MRIKSIFTLSLALATTATLFTSCKKDPVIPNEEEVITTMTYTLTPVGGGAPVVMSFTDLDGDGGLAPVIVGGTLTANTNYTGSLILLNEQESPAGDITAEVAAEAADHQFFYQPAAGLNLTAAYNDLDADGAPIGLLTNVAAGAASTGTLTITLRHLPDKWATGVTGGDITNAGGETDIEVSFDVIIQ